MALWQSIKRDIQAALERDPAARSALEVVLAYPGFHARQIHRLAHALWRRRIPLLPRLISHLGRAVTGIEIHPGAQIGEGLFIDHGMGVVIGETAVIGDDCTLYQGVTLGGVSTRRTKRHPTLGNRVVVGAGAKLLGSIEIGDDVKVGAGSVVVQSVPPNATVVGVPGRVVAIRDADTGTIERLPDPVAEAITALQERVRQLEERLARLEGRPPQPLDALTGVEDLLASYAEASNRELR
jgi:serine O-acetyltransferase